MVLSLVLAGCASSPPQILSLTPNHGATGVEANAPVTVVFDKPVVHASIAAHFLMSPGLPGCNLAYAAKGVRQHGCWISWLSAEPGFTLFHPTTPFASNTKYTFSLTSGLHAVDGSVNVFSHTWNITTDVAPRFQSSYPAQHAKKVPLDSILTVSFSRAMLPASSTGITLAPAVPGTTIVQDVSTPSQFDILPGHLLLPNHSYTLTVSTQVRDITYAKISRETAIHFSTGASLSVLPHLLLASSSTVDLLPIPSSADIHAPVPYIHLFSGTSSTTVGAASLSTGTDYLALTEVQTSTGASDLHVINVVNGTDRPIGTGASHLSWSPNGQMLAYTTGTATLAIYNTLSGSTQSYPLPAPLLSPPLWNGDSSLLYLSLQGNASAPPSIVSFSPALDAYAPIPNLPLFAYTPLSSPDHSLLVYLGRALPTDPTSVWWTSLATTPATSTSLSSGFTLFGVTNSSSVVAAPAVHPTEIGFLSLSTGDFTSLTTSALPDTPVAVSANGQLMAYLGGSAAHPVLSIQPTSISASSILATRLPSHSAWRMAFQGLTISS